ncbi:MAG: hypothetical protein EOO42_12290 [Flavobacteriales bacterium]|nr:MAG: hypothetical protein EOO42_12290 [Flavobacteriales bacterium]
MRKKLCFLAVILFAYSTSFAQTIISGKLLDNEQKPATNVTVSLKKKGSPVILGYTKSDVSGVFKLTVTPIDTDSLQLDFNHMSYERLSVLIINSSANYTYQLKSQVQQLKEVKIGNVPIFKRKDTINYSVNAFTSVQDRVIADIIKKLPGVEVRGDEILYQGQPIKKYMVNNLDLMEGRYGMINNNLPADAVRNVQILENDQPIKILDSMVFSNRASLNIELKKFTTTGTGKIGVGAAPVLWDLNMTPMTFGKRFQMLNSFQTNNVGNDVSRDLRSFYNGMGFMSNNLSVAEGTKYISIRNVASPDFDEKKWLDNKIFLVNTNILQKLKNGLELKGNISYYNDTRNRTGVTSTQYFTDQAIISNSESISNRYRVHVLDAGILVEKNEKEIYLRNNLKYHRRWNNEVGNLLFNGSNKIDQHLSYQDQSFLNNLVVGRFVGKQLVNIQSNLVYSSTPQNLRVSPGQFQQLLNSGQPFDEMEQRVLFKGLTWNNSIGLIKKLGNWRLSPKAELNYNRNTLATEIITTENGDVKVLDSGYFNDMNRSVLHLAMNLGIGWERKKWKLDMSIPYNFFYYNVTQQDVKTLENVPRNTITPNANLTYILDARNELSTSLSGGRQYGGLENYYNGYIIDSYRSIQRFDSRLLQTDAKKAMVSYRYKNTSKATFANASYQYYNSRRDFTYTSFIDPNGSQTNSIADRSSRSESHNLWAGGSRLFSSLKTVLKLNGNLSWNFSDYLLNGNTNQLEVRNQSANFEMVNNYLSFISLEYKSVLGQSTSQFSGGQRNKVSYNNHYLNLVVYPIKKHIVTINNSFYSNNVSGQKNQYFLDMNYRYRIEKWKTDIELIGNNLLANSRYLQQYSSNYELVRSYFVLRPRQFLIATKFKF